MQYRSGTDYQHRVKVTGIVTYYKPRESVILEEGGRALYVAAVEDNTIQLGDRVEGPDPAGCASSHHGTRRALATRACECRRTRIGVFNNNLVSVQGRFLRRVEEPYRVVLLIQADSTLLLAQLSEPDHSDLLKNLKEGSIVRVTGISMLDAQGTWNIDGPSASAIHYEIVLRSLDDVRMIAAPSWWTIRNVIYIASISASLVMIFAARDIYARITHWRLQVVLDEWERMTLEMHDTLAQSLAGIGFQLQAMRRTVSGDTPELLRLVDVARALVQHSHKEARRHSEQSVVQTQSTMDLLDALKECACAIFPEVRLLTQL